MRRWHTLVGMVAAAALATGLSSCAQQDDEVMIESAAADMNLASTDVGSDLELVADERLADFEDRLDVELRADMVELNRRMFSGSDRVVWSWVVTYPTAPLPGTAFRDLGLAVRMANQQWLGGQRSDVCQLFGFQHQTFAEEHRREGACHRTISVVGLAPSARIEDAEFGMATDFVRLGGSEDTIHAYVLIFRRANVVGILEVVGLSESVEQNWVEDLATVMEAKMG